MKPLPPSLEEPVNLASQSRREEVDFNLGEILILHGIKIQIVEVRWDVCEIAHISFMIRFRAFNCAMIRKEEGAEIVPLLYQPQLFGFPLL